MKRHIVIDIDGVISDASARQPFLDESWEAYHAALAQDPPIEPTLSVIKGLSAAGYEILVCTGRPARYDRQTLSWLNKYEVPATELLMRGENDYRSEAEVKIGLLTDYFGSLEAAQENVLVGFEVKDKTVEALRNNGFQIWSLS